jgi:hypothetical protein
MEVKRVAEEGPTEPEHIIPSSALLSDAIHGSSNMLQTQRRL